MPLTGGVFIVIDQSFRRNSFLRALQGLKKLLTIEFGSGTDRDHPFLLTSSRLVALLWSSWNDLENLTIRNLASCDRGSHEDEALFWAMSTVRDAKTHDCASPICTAASQMDGMPSHNKLRTIKLYDPDVPAEELAVLLRDVSRCPRREIFFVRR